MRILVQPDQLRQNARLLRASSEFWHSQSTQLYSALSKLDWQTRTGAAVEYRAQQAIALAERLAVQAKEKAAFLEMAAARFEHADISGAQRIAQTASIAKVSTTTAPPLDLPRVLTNLLVQGRWDLSQLFTRLVPPSYLPIGLVLLSTKGWPGSLTEWIWNWLHSRSKILSPIPEVASPVPKGKLSQVILSGLERAKQQKPSYAPPLIPVNPEQYRNNCAFYVQARRPDLGPTGGQGGAADYIDKYRDKVFRVSVNTIDLRDRVGVGYAVVWDRGHPQLRGTAGEQHGHVAIVEEVGSDYIVVSHTNWGNSYTMKISREQLVNWGLYFIP